MQGTSMRHDTASTTETTVLLNVAKFVMNDIFRNGAPAPAEQLTGKTSRGANISYTLKLTGKVKPDDDSSAVTAIRYRVAGDDKIYSVTLPAGGIALKNMNNVTPAAPTQTPSMPSGKSGGGCDAGFAGMALLGLGCALLLRRK